MCNGAGSIGQMAEIFNIFCPIFRLEFPEGNNG